jgi:arginyl-tRNA synthetase
VLGADGKPYKTREGVAVGLGELLDGAIEKAYEVVSTNDDASPGGPQLSEERRQHIARTVGLAALKYGDLSHNRTSDYVFSFEKMTAMEGNTATYIQYSYARVMSIFRKGEIDVNSIRSGAISLSFTDPAERALAIELLRFGDALNEVTLDYRPNLLTNYLFELSKRFAEFFQNCPVLTSEGETRHTRLVLCDLTARTLKLGLSLLGINVVDKM